MIPKIIHYCWLSDDPVPQKLQECMDTWRIHLKDYKFIKWDFSRFEKESSVWVSEAFDNKKYAFAADYIRLFAVYNYGGIYLDMDMEVLKSFDDLLDQEVMLAYERPDQSGIEAGCFGAEMKNSYIKECLSHYDNRHFIKEDGTFDQTVLPKIMKKYLPTNNCPFPIYEYDYFTVKSYDNGQIEITDRSYTVHHFAGSWLSPIEQELVFESQRLSLKYGQFIGRNIAQYKHTYKYQGVVGVLQLTLKKIKRNI